MLTPLVLEYMLTTSFTILFWFKVPKACVLRDHVVADDAGGVTFIEYPPHSKCTLGVNDTGTVVAAWSQRVVDNGECDAEADKTSRYFKVAFLLYFFCFSSFFLTFPSIYLLFGSDSVYIAAALNTLPPLPNSSSPAAMRSTPLFIYQSMLTCVI